MIATYMVHLQVCVSTDSYDGRSLRHLVSLLPNKSGKALSQRGMASKLWKRMAKAYVALVRRESLTAAVERLEEISTVLRRIQTRNTSRPSSTSNPFHDLDSADE